MFKTFTTRLAAWRRERETIRELSQLTNRELADLGIGRGDIPFVAAGASVDDVQSFITTPATAEDGALIGPNWAAHAPTSLAA
ncbi:DUF1127 domain-containing protein [Lichenibacterium ramalinae]|uniref:DUF1127 domain-containing protein n=1 Tax=Lichenibacterium ramalinae TaxID=2316527 RepID=A0A4Q2RDW8_9HYPH|nr:DUF1127 domain-containing protein [Lichenibacterium ramalinae]